MGLLLSTQKAFTFYSILERLVYKTLVRVEKLLVKGRQESAKDVNSQIRVTRVTYIGTMGVRCRRIFTSIVSLQVGRNLV